MKDVSAVHDQIVTLFQEKLNLEVPSVDTDLIEAGILDSLSFVELIVSLEEMFGTGIPSDDIEIDNFRSISRIAALITGVTESASWRGVA
jgi:acyl carrier protein